MIFKEVHKMNELEPVYVDDFEKIRQIIEQARQEAAYKVNETIISLYWNIGKFVSEKAQQDGWGRSTVKQLSQYILSKEPGIRGYSAQNIWRMKQFFETYQDKPELSTLLRANTWSNNLHIMSKTKTDEERAFYLKLAEQKIESFLILNPQITKITKIISENPLIRGKKYFTFLESFYGCFERVLLSRLA